MSRCLHELWVRNTKNRRFTRFIFHSELPKKIKKREDGWVYIRGFCKPEVNFKPLIKNPYPYVVLDNPLIKYSRETRGDLLGIIELVNETVIHELVHYLGDIKDEWLVEWAYDETRRMIQAQ